MSAPDARRLPTAAADALLLTAALIWGSTFVAQKMATEHMGPVLFNGIRYFAGALALAPIALSRWRRTTSPAARRSAVVGGLLAGAAMAIASSAQQVGMHATSVSNAGFITGLYVIIVPMLGLFVGQRVRWTVWSGAALAVVGLFFLSLYDPASGRIELGSGDAWVLACAFAWSVHVQVIGWAAPDADAFVISALQFGVTGVTCLVGAAVLSTAFGGHEWGAREAFRWDGFTAALGPLAFATVLSTCVAFTLQVVAQASAPPAHAAILLSLESVFSALAEAAVLLLGWTTIGAPMTGWKLLGCALMFAGVVVSQVRLGGGRRDAAPGATAPGGSVA